MQNLNGATVTIITSCVTLLGIIISAIISYMATKKSVNESNNVIREQILAEQDKTSQSLSAQYVTDKRIAWIHEVRGLIAEFITIALDYSEYYKAENVFNHQIIGRGQGSFERKRPDFYREINLRLSKLKLCFNFKGNLDGEIINKLEFVAWHTSIENKGFDFSDYYYAIDHITKLSQIYLKLEWERCKMETKWDVKSRFNDKEGEIKEKMNQLEEEYRKLLHCRL